MLKNVSMITMFSFNWDVTWWNFHQGVGAVWLTSVNRGQKVWTMVHRRRFFYLKERVKWTNKFERCIRSAIEVLENSWYEKSHIVGFSWVFLENSLWTVVTSSEPWFEISDCEPNRPHPIMEVHDFVNAVHKNPKKCERRSQFWQRRSQCVGDYFLFCFRSAVRCSRSLGVYYLSRRKLFKADNKHKNQIFLKYFVNGFLRSQSESKNFASLSLLPKLASEFTSLVFATE